MFTCVKSGYQICLLFAIAFLLLACTKTDIKPPTPGIPNNPDPPPVAVREKTLKITLIGSNDDSYWHSMFSYDSSGRLVSFTGVPGDYKVYYQNDTIHHILEPRTTDNGAFIRSSWIFMYGADKKLVKVFYKHLITGNPGDVVEDSPFWGSTTDGQAVLMDSLTYSPTGQLTGIWSPAGPYYCQFVYDSANAVAPSTINDYFDPDQDGVYDYLSYTTLLTYTDADQPGSQQLWFFPFIGFYAPATPTPPATDSRFFLVLLKKQVRQYRAFNDRGYYEVSQNFKYGYSADSTHFSGLCDPANELSSNFYYLYSKQ